MSAMRWEHIPPSRVVSLGDLEASALYQLADPTLPDEPTLLVVRPLPSATGERAIAGLLAALQTTATQTFPAWPPGAEAVVTSGGAVKAALEPVCRRAAREHGRRSLR